MLEYLQEVANMSENNNPRANLVVKSNDLIQKSRFSLNVQQQKIVLYLISKLKYNDNDFKEFEINLKDFCKCCGINLNCGRTYNELKESIKQIADKSMWIEREDGAETLVRWIEKPTIYKNDGIITIKLDDDLKPYLLNLKEKYTQYELIYTLQLRSKFSIRLYELMKSLHYDKLKEYTVRYSISELKKKIDASNYKAYGDFRRRVLEKAVEEINSFTDILISYKTFKRGRAIAEIEFYISTKEPLKRLQNYETFEKKIDKKTK